MIQQRDVLVSIQTDLGQGAQTIRQLFWNLKKDFVLKSASSAYKIERIEPEGDLPKLQIVLKLQTDLSIQHVLEKIDQALQNTQRQKMTGSLRARLLAYGQDITNVQYIALPDPELHTRPEYAVPSAEVWPEYIHPVLGQPLGVLVQNLEIQDTRVEFYSQGMALLDFSNRSE